jgi:hypothetical protein
MKIKVMDWDQLISELASNIKPSFKTNYNYVKCLNSLSQNLDISTKFNIKKNGKPPKSFLNKIKLIKALKDSLTLEFKLVSDINEASSLHNSWIATKSYYLFYHCWSVIYYLIKSEESSLRVSHKKISEFLKTEIINNKIIFTNEEFNKVYSYSEIKEMKGAKGANLYDEFDNCKMINFILRKIANLRLEEFKRLNHIKNFMEKKSKDLKKVHESSEKVCLLDFFYQNRIKTDYLSLEFLQDVDDVRSHYQFYKEYYELTINFYHPLVKIIKELSNKRFGSDFVPF